jgi:hypothetical protein
MVGASVPQIAKPLAWSGRALRGWVHDVGVGTTGIVLDQATLAILADEKANGDNRLILARHAVDVFDAVDLNSIRSSGVAPMEMASTTAP